MSTSLEHEKSAIIECCIQGFWSIIWNGQFELQKQLRCRCGAQLKSFQSTAMDTEIE